MRMRTLVLSLLLTGSALSLAAAPAHAAAERKKGGGLTYQQLPTLTASLLRPDGERGVLTVEAGIDAPDPALHARMVGSQPRLMDAYVRWLATYAATMTPGAPPNPDQIGQGLQHATDLVLGRPGARVLLGTILVN